MARLCECVPNFSVGDDPAVVGRIVRSIEDGGCRVLHTDSGKSAARTVVTFAGSPECVEESAFRAVETASRLIDMGTHRGTHPRMGATDVLPIVPLEGVTMKECVDLSRRLAQRIYTSLGIPTYLYANSARTPERFALEWCRKGGYEALPERIADSLTRPDFSPPKYNGTVRKSGATIVGARDFLLAVNFNLDTDDPSIATEIARDVRQSGRFVTQEDGSKKRIPGALKGCKAIGWTVEEWGIAQVSMNITDIGATPLHIAYETVREKAAERGVNVTGTHIVGLLPKRVLLEAGEYFLEKKRELPGDSHDESALMETAIREMNFRDRTPFSISEKVIEEILRRKGVL